MEINDEFLAKIKSEIIRCRGDIYKRNLNGEDELVEKDVNLQYDTVYNTFLKEEDICYASSLGEAVLDNNEEQIEEKRNILEDHFLYTDIPYIDGMLYVDKKSIYEIKNKHSRR